jgi:chromosome segregation ATPase
MSTVYTRSVVDIKNAEIKVLARRVKELNAEAVNAKNYIVTLSRTVTDQANDLAQVKATIEQIQAHYEMEKRRADDRASENGQLRQQLATQTERAEKAEERFRQLSKLEELIRSQIDDYMTPKPETNPAVHRENIANTLNTLLAIAGLHIQALTQEGEDDARD